MSKALTETSKQRLCVQRTDGWCESAADAAQVTPELSVGMRFVLLPNVCLVTAVECAPRRKIRWYRVLHVLMDVGIFYLSGVFIMKNFVRAIALLLLAFTVLPLLFACGGADGKADDTTPADQQTPDTTPPPETTTAPEALDLTVFADGATDFVILRPDSEDAAVEAKAASELCNAFRAATGKYIKITTDWKTNAVNEYEICVGNVARNGEYYNIDTASIPQDEFIVKVCGTRIVLLGNNEYGTSKAVEWFIENYLSATDASLTSLSVPADFSYSAKFEQPKTIRIMTQNLLGTDTEYQDYVKDPKWADRIKVDLSQHTLAVRQPRVLDLFKTYAPDAIGVQECSASWRTYFDKNLSKISYRRVGASKNQKIGIVYNTNTLKVVTHASFWLSENPEKLPISAEWGAPSDGLTERLGMYIVFEVIATGERFIMFNTHLDTTKNNIIQTKQTEVLLDYIAKAQEKYPGLPVVMTGDFNYNMTSAHYKVLMSTTLGDTKKLSTKSEGGGSFNKFIGQSYASQPIDQIVATKDGFVFHAYKVLYDTVDGCFLSDHYAVIADMEIK